MAKLTISKSDLLKNQPSEPGWYKSTVKKIVLEKSKDAKSWNFVTDFELEANSKEIRTWFNTGAIGTAAPFVEAVTGKPINPDSDFEIDTDELVGKHLQVHVVNDTYQGRIVDKIDNYADYNSDMTPAL